MYGGCLLCPLYPLLPLQRALRALLFYEECPTYFITCARACETGPTVYRPYPRRLESITVYKCYYKRQHFLPLKINLQVTRISIAKVTKICWQISDNTRIFRLSYITHCRNNFPKFSIRFQGPKCFNSLRREIQQ